MKNSTPSTPDAPPPMASTPQNSGGTPAASAPVDTGGYPDLLTVDQAAAHLQVSASSIRSYIREGRLKAFRVAGLRKVLIPRAELLALLEPARQPRPANPSTGRPAGRPAYGQGTAQGVTADG